jgi:hypothetical protein
MADLYAVSPARHLNKRWKRLDNYNFSKQEMAAVLLAREMPEAHLSMPVGFRQIENGFVPVAILGLGVQQNIFVGSRGEWLGAYTPYIYRSYPFRLGKKDNDERTLSIDESSGAITDDLQAEPFFINESTPSDAVVRIFKTLVQIEKEGEKTRQLCDSLNLHALLEEWPIKVRDEKEAVNTVMGYYRISEAALNALPANALVELRDSGALLLAYCQLLSMRNLSVFAKLREQQVQSANPYGSQFIKVSEANGIISFDNL